LKVQEECDRRSRRSPDLHREASAVTGVQAFEQYWVDFPYSSMRVSSLPSNAARQPAAKLTPGFLATNEHECTRIVYLFLFVFI
jgi:hypothetical protein